MARRSGDLDQAIALVSDLDRAERAFGGDRSLAKLNADLKPEHIATEVTKDFRPRFKKAVTDSINRANAKAIK